MSATPDFPRPHNEPDTNYAEGTANLRELRARLDDRSVPEIPTVIGGKKYFTGDTTNIYAPHDNTRLLAKVHRPTKELIALAVEDGLRSAKDWERTPFADRVAIMHRAAAIVAGRMRHRINAATMLGQSKTLDEADADSTCELVDFLRFNTYNAQKVLQENPLTTEKAQNRIDWRPLEGLVYAVSPFNFTAIGANLTCAPALMGNVVLWKPSDKSTWSNYIFYEALEEAGLPPGVINFVPGDAVAVTDAVFGSRDFAGLHFTGSSSVFRSLWKRAAAGVDNYRSFPRLVGETGGKDFVLAHASANADEVAVALFRGAFGYQGQKCSAASRGYIPKSLWPAVKAKLQEISSTIKVGDVADFSNFNGAVIDRLSYDKLSSRIAAALKDSNVELVTGGKYWSEPGNFIQPTVFEVKDPLHNLMKEELFGPVLAIYVYDDTAWNEVLQLVDTTSEYALTGSLFCTDRFAMRHAQEVLVNAAGNLYVNDKPTGAIIGQQPFGGGRSSGTNDKAGSWMNLLRWTSPRTVKETYAPPRSW